ncbi:hypothetical protein, partial [Psychromonas aquatilis]
IASAREAEATAPRSKTKIIEVKYNKVKSEVLFLLIASTRNAEKGVAELLAHRITQRLLKG